MRKTDKKLENKLRASLTNVCQFAEDAFPGFCWLTHTVNYAQFPTSLQVICVFDSTANLNDFLSNKDDRQFNQVVNKQLNRINISLKDIASHIEYRVESTTK